MATIVNQLIPLGLAGFMYLVLGIHFWRTRWTEAAPLAPVGVNAPAWEKLAIGITLALHGAGLESSLFEASRMQFSFSLAFSLMIWLAVLIYWLESFRVRMDGLQPLVLLGGVAACLLPLLFSKTHLISNAGSLGFRLHFLAAMLAYSLFTLSAAHAVFMGFAEKKLHQRQLSRRMASMPPLLAMETLLFRMLTLAFALLTLTLGSGLLYSEILFGQPFRLDHKTFFAISSWVIFAILLTGRHIYGWRGRIALRWTLAGFAVLLLAYVGSRFVVEVLLNRA
ncbi:MAG: cytochrome c biogenesis protein CcsA [Azovibrio sp.]|uniref:cytochrome C assembly family protein n=1 Tax=Azovibrio sp. TaxID=1872673 RepID=UPI003C77CA9A